MRVTERMFQKRLLAGVQSAKERLTSSQERIATQKNIRHPSDDPIGFMKVMSYHRQLFKLRQTIRNAENVSVELLQMDTALQTVNDMLLDAKNAVTTMANGTMGAEERAAPIGEIDLMIDDMRQKANTEFGGRYIFSGHKVFTQPYVQQTTFEDDNWNVDLLGGGPINMNYSLPPDAADADVTINIYDSSDVLVRTDNIGMQSGGAQTYIWDGLNDVGGAAPDANYVFKVSVDYGGLEYIGDQGKISQKIELNGSMVVNIPGSDIFGTLDSGLFKTMADLRAALASNDQDAIRGSITALSTEINNVTAARGEIGVKIKRVEASTNELSTMEPILTNNLSQAEDVDLIAEAGEYLAAQEAYQTALETAASALQLPTLLDFIR